MQLLQRSRLPPRGSVEEEATTVESHRKSARCRRTRANYHSRSGPSFDQQLTEIMMSGPPPSAGQVQPPPPPVVILALVRASTSPIFEDDIEAKWNRSRGSAHLGNVLRRHACPSVSGIRVHSCVSS